MSLTWVLFQSDGDRSTSRTLTGLVQGSVGVTCLRNCDLSSAQPSTVLKVVRGTGWRLRA